MPARVLVCPFRPMDTRLLQMMSVSVSELVPALPSSGTYWCSVWQRFAFTYCGTLGPVAI